MNSIFCCGRGSSGGCKFVQISLVTDFAVSKPAEDTSTACSAGHSELTWGAEDMVFSNILTHLV